MTDRDGEIVPKLTRDEMYQAVVTNQARYDGVFYYAVTTTGVVCRPSCKSRAPSRAHTVFFATLAEALRHGYRPCKRCRPDLGPRYRPAADVIATALTIIKREYLKPRLLPELPKRIGISMSHLQRLFRQHTGHTLKWHIQQRRITQAAMLLRDTAMSVIDVGLTVGFASPSSFCAAFRGVTGLSPTAYRRRQGNQAVSRHGATRP